MSTLGGKEGFEDFLPNIFWHSHSIVGKLELQSAVVPVARNPQTTSARHRVNGVHDQIYENFTQFRRAAVSAGTAYGFQLDVVFESPETSFVLPASSRDFDCVLQQVSHV